MLLDYSQLRLLGLAPERVSGGEGKGWCGNFIRFTCSTRKSEGKGKTDRGEHFTLMDRILSLPVWVVAEGKAGPPAKLTNFTLFPPPCTSLFRLPSQKQMNITFKALSPSWRSPLFLSVISIGSVVR